VSVALQYLAAWLGGSGAVAINNLMEDAATAEIARSQLWQWIRHRVRTAEDTAVTLQWVRDLLREETASLRAGQPDPERLDRAAALLDALLAAETFPEFLTLAAYEEL
jgi:malate synthase